MYVHVVCMCVHVYMCVSEGGGKEEQQSFKARSLASWATQPEAPPTQKPHPAPLPYEPKGQQFLQVKGKVYPEGRLEESCDGLLIFKPHSGQSEEEGTAHSTKEPSPVVPHRKVSGRYLNAEQNTCGFSRKSVECFSKWWFTITLF